MSCLSQSPAYFLCEGWRLFLTEVPIVCSQGALRPSLLPITGRRAGAELLVEHLDRAERLGQGWLVCAGE